MPYISVIIPTNRIGGLDILFSGLENQIFKDFELILVDILYDHRKSIVEEKSKKYSFNTKHILQQQTNGVGYCAAMNAGLVIASGHLVFFMCDYSWLYPNCLQIHADFHQKEMLNTNCGLICSYSVCKLPKLHNNLKRTYGNIVPYDTEENKKKFIETECESLNNYIDDINGGGLDALMWSIFDEQIIPIYDINSLEVIATKQHSDGQVGTDCCYLKNETHTLKNILDINGLNEKLDGSHGWQDFEFADRLTTLLGTKLYNKSNITVMNIDPRSVLYGRKRSRDVYSNDTIWKKEKAARFKDINTWSLKDVRKKNGL